MKSVAFIPIFLLCAFAQAEERNELKKIGLHCAKKVGIDKAVIEDAVATAILPKENMKYREFLACSYKKQGYQDEEGHILYENIKKFLSKFYKESDLRAIDTCKETPESNDADNAFNALYCILEILKKLKDKK